MNDMDKLIEAVERGDEISVICFARGIASNERDAGKEWPHYEVSKAFRGDLNAAAALHETLLPGWDWCITPDGASVYSPIDHSPTDCDGKQKLPARAWLLATLKALRAKESTDDR